ncbi:MAG: XdhC family protein [Acidimicrobiales bacterium]
MAEAELSLAEQVCLALVVDSPRHGWALVRELDPSGELGAIWSLSRSLTYRAVDLLERKGLVTRGAAEAGRGPNRMTLTATAAGETVSAAWLEEPVRHVRDLRTEFLLKATLLQRRDGDVLRLLDAQEAALTPRLEALGNDLADRSPVGLWRRESARAAQRFFGQVRAGLTDRPAAPAHTVAGSATAPSGAPSAAPAMSTDDRQLADRVTRPQRDALAETVEQLGAELGSAAVARTVELRGFGPDRPGEVALITGDTVTGRVLNGAIDDALVAGAEDLRSGERAATTVGVTVGAADAAAAGLTCGGTAKVLIQRADTLPELFWGDGLGVPRASITRLTGPTAGATLTVTQLGDRAGTLGDAAADEAAIGIATGQMRWGVGGVTAVDDGAHGELLVDVVWSSRRLFVVGSGELAATLQSVAVGLGWSTYTTNVVSEATTYLADATPSDAVVVLSHDPAIDTPVLCAALASAAGYVGALGSRRTQSARTQRLLAAGATPDQVASLHGPAGLDLGAAGPPEIAVSIVAEIIATRSGRGAAPLASTTGPIQNRFRTT